MVGEISDDFSIDSTNWGEAIFLDFPKVVVDFQSRLHGSYHSISKTNTVLNGVLRIRTKCMKLKINILLCNVIRYYKMIRYVRSHTVLRRPYRHVTTHKCYFTINHVTIKVCPNYKVPKGH